MSERAELLRRESQTWQELSAAIAAVPSDRRMEPGVVPGWSVQDLLWHCAKWADFVGAELEALAAGTPVAEDRPDSYWQELNEAWAEESKTLVWDHVEEAARAGRERACAALLALPALTPAAVHEFTDETVQHYADHAAEITAFVAATEPLG